MRLVLVFILNTHNQTNYKCLPKFVQTDNTFFSIKSSKYDTVADRHVSTATAGFLLHVAPKNKNMQVVQGVQIANV